MPATNVVSYEVDNHLDLLSDVYEKALKYLNRENGSNKKLRAKILRAIQEANFTGLFQIEKPEAGQMRTIGELCESYKYETTDQHLDPKAVDRVLFGPYGLVKKSGGGYFDKLMEDIEVAYIHDAFTGSNVGPIISSGRNRLVSLQLMLKAAGMPQEAINQVRIRVSVIRVGSMGEVQARIISANTGSRSFSSAEVRERRNSDAGVRLTSCDGIEESIQFAKNQDALKAALCSWIRLKAEELGLKDLSPEQYANAGTSLWNELTRQHKPHGMTFYRWIAEDTTRYIKMLRCIESSLASCSTAVLSNTASGQAGSKLAKCLRPLISSQLML